MSTPTDPSDSMNANQFDDEGLPGIDEAFPPENSWGVEDPALLNSETAQDNLTTRVAREGASAIEGAVDAPPPILMEPAAGDPAVEGDLIDDEAQALAIIGEGDPDAGPTAEQAAMRVVDEPSDDQVD